MTQKQPNTHGGQRPGAGRKPRGDGPRVSINVRLDPDLAAFLATIPKTATIEKALKNLKEYKAWKKLPKSV